MRADTRVLRVWCLALLVVSFPGCATSLKREGRCLASLTPDFLQATEELVSLEAAWHWSLLKGEDSFPASRPRHVAELDGPGIPARPFLSDSDPLYSGSTNPHKEVRSTAVEAHARLLEARRRHQPTLDWYGRVYDRLRTRLEEEQLLSDVRLVLLTGPGLLLYPIVRWNLHSVMWDGFDPDADSDSITLYCTDRLSRVAALPDPISVQSE